jgi:hypothetical protein
MIFQPTSHRDPFPPRSPLQLRTRIENAVSLLFGLATGTFDRARFSKNKTRRFQAAKLRLG